MYTYKSLASEYNVSPDTIRKQLDKLANDHPDKVLRTKCGRSWAITELGVAMLAQARGESVPVDAEVAEVVSSHGAITRYNKPVIERFVSPFESLPTVTPTDIIRAYDISELQNQIIDLMSQIKIESANYQLKKDTFEQAILDKARAEGVALALQAHRERVAAFDGAQAHFLAEQ